MKRKKIELKPHKRTPEEEAAWEEWAKTGKGSPPGFTRIEPPSDGSVKLIVTVRPKRKAEAEPEVKHDFETAAKILGDGFTAEDARRLHELFTGQ
jgi:hypothetical protein